MIDSAKVNEVCSETLKEQGAFLVELMVSAGNQILIRADHPDGMNLKKLAQVHRAIEGAFDREEEDFDIEVSSPGATEPFKVLEQYLKNVGRDVKVTTHQGEVHQGVLDKFENDQLTLSWKERVPKEIGKGKRTVTRECCVALSTIKETRLELKF